MLLITDKVIEILLSWYPGARLSISDVQSFNIVKVLSTSDNYLEHIVELTFIFTLKTGIIIEIPLRLITPVTIYALSRTFMTVNHILLSDLPHSSLFPVHFVAESFIKTWSWEIQMYVMYPKYGTPLYGYEHIIRVAIYGPFDCYNIPKYFFFYWDISVSHLWVPTEEQTPMLAFLPILDTPPVSFSNML